MTIVAFHFLLAILFFYIVNWLGSNASAFGYSRVSVLEAVDEAPGFNVIFRVASPIVLVILTATILYALKQHLYVYNIWLVVVYYTLYRVLFNVILGRTRLINWSRQAVVAGLNIGVVYALYESILKHPQALLPDLQSITNEFWIVIILFLFYLVNSLRLENRGVNKRRRQYVEHQLKKFQDQYGDVIRDKVQDDRLVVLVYAILIMESFNRPELYRLVERKLLFPLGLSHTLGVMQVRTSDMISDRESVELGIEKVNNDFIESRVAKREEMKRRRPTPPNDDDSNIELSDRRKQEVLWATVKKYNPDREYVSEVMSLYRNIKDSLADTLNE